MNEKQEKILSSLLEICDDLVSGAFVVTDGYMVSAIVLDEGVAKYLCKEMRKQYNNDKWVYLSIPMAIEYAYSIGRESGYLIDESPKPSKEQS